MRNSNIWCGLALLPISLIIFATIWIVTSVSSGVLGVIAAGLFTVGNGLALWVILFRNEWDWRLPKWEILICFVCLGLSEWLVRPANAWLWRTNWIVIGGALIVSNLPKWLNRKYPAQLSLCVLGLLCLLTGILSPTMKRLDPAMQQVAGKYQQLKSGIFPSPTAQTRLEVSTVPTSLAGGMIVPSVSSCNPLLMAGFDWQSQANLPEALRSYSEALACYQQHGDPIGEAITLDHIGRLHNGLGELNEALSAFQQESVLWKALGDRVNEGTALNSIGTVYQSMGDTQNALRNFQDSLDLARESGIPIGEARALNSLGQLNHTLGHYEEAISYYQEALKIIRSVENRNLEVILLNNLGGSYYAKGDNSEASKYLNEAILLARQIQDQNGERMAAENLKRLDDSSLSNAGPFQLLQPDTQSLAGSVSPNPVPSLNDNCDIFMQQAVNLYQQDMEPDGLQNFAQAWKCYKESGNLVAQGGALAGMGTIQLDLGYFDQALSTYRQALEIARQTNDPKSEVVGLLNIGFIEHTLKRYEDALVSYQEMLVVARKIGDAHYEALAQSKLGGVYHEIGQYGTALDAFGQALVLFIQMDDTASVSASLVNIGICFDRMGNYQKALQYHQRALEIARELGDRSIEAYTLKNIGGVHFRLEEYQEALKFYAQSLKLTQQGKNTLDEAEILSDFGQTYKAMGMYPDSIESYGQSLDIYRAMNDKVHESEILGKLADVFQLEGQYQTTLKYYNQSILIDQDLQDKLSEGRHTQQIGLAYAQSGQWDAALFHFQKAFNLFQGINNEIGMAFTLSDMGNINQQQNQLDKAFNHYQESIHHFQNSRSIDMVEDIHHTLPNEMLSAYQNTILLLVKQGRYEEALHFAEEARVRGLASQLYETRLNRIIDSHLQGSSQTQELESRIWSLEQRLETELLKPTQEQNRVQISSLADSLRAKSLEYEAKTKIYGSPDDTIFNTAPLTLPEIREMLKGITLVEYVVTQKSTIAFVVTSQELHAVQMNITQDELSQQINSFYQFSSLEGVPEASKELYQQLVAPIESYVRNENLLIAPNGILNYVPFASLHDGTQYLVEKYTLFYTPSASTYAFALDNRKATHQPPLIFSDPTGDLPNAREEAQKIHDLFSFSLKTLPLHQEQDALERWVWEQADRAGILHFASHGVYDPHNPLFSYILLRGDEQEDGRLEVYEIYKRGLNLNNASLVVLSACETNLGSMSNGDEIVGLSRAFIYAGAPTVISSLWKVDDLSTQVLMEHFYSYLRDGKTKAQALRAAQLDLIASPEYSHPYYWAAFDLTGDSSEMPQGNVFWSDHWVLIQIGVLILGFISLRLVNSQAKTMMVTKRSAIFWGWLIGLLALPILFLGLFMLGYLLQGSLGIPLVSQDIIYYVLPSRSVIMKDPLGTSLIAGVLTLWGGSLAAFGANLREGRLKNDGQET
jgi:CHAT domain-containing protein/Tfp pilus assembly protein PilF